MSRTSTSDTDIDDTGSNEGYEHVVTETDEDRLECTIFPRDCDGDEFLTRWVSAHGDSFTSLEDAV